MNKFHSVEAFLVRELRRANYLGRRRLGAGVRSVVGLLFIIGGVFGFLPILGFWMIPVGAFLIAIDIPAFRGPMRRWLNEQKKRVRAKHGGGSR